jgi:hypothetical protein
MYDVIAVRAPRPKPVGGEVESSQGIAKLGGSQIEAPGRGA